MSGEMTRRDLLRLAAGGIGALAVGGGLWEGLGLGAEALAATAPGPIVAVARNQSPAALVQAAVNALGGMKRFVKPGNRVLVKPNAAWQRAPEYAATTNPEVLAEVIRLCKQAGAKSVLVMDHPCDKPDDMTFTVCGLRQASQKAGARMIGGSSAALYETIRLPRGKVLKSSQTLKAVKEADVFINVPIAKVHGASVLTLGMKNLMGTTFDRGAWHNSPDLHQAIADYSTVIRPHLTIVDAVRILLTNGPKGPGQTRDTRMIIAGTDPVAVDAYAAHALFQTPPERIRHIALAHAAGVGVMDLSRIRVKSA